VHAPHVVGVVEGVLVTLREQRVAQAAVNVKIEPAALLAFLGRQA